jgi:hypothetical protein
MLRVHGGSLMVRLILYVLVFLTPWILAWLAVTLCALEGEYAEHDATEPLPPTLRARSKPRRAWWNQQPAYLRLPSKLRPTER